MNRDYDTLLKSLPPSMRKRFTSLGKYVREVTTKVLEDQGLKKSKRRVFVNTHLPAISYVVLINKISQTLKEGIFAAGKAIEAARALGQDGIVVGTTTFSEDSEELASWRDLDRRLDAIVSESQLGRFAQGQHVWDWVTEMVEDIQRG